MIEWFRSWHGAPTDPKWRTIARRAGVRPGDVAAVAWVLFDRASQASDRGSIEGYDAEVIADALGYEPDDIIAIIAAMIDKGVIIDGRIAAWEKYQPKREREQDDSADRVRTHRAAKRHVTPCNANDSQETPREDTDTDKKQDIPPSTSEGVVVRAEAPPRAPKPPYPEAFEALWAVYRPIASLNSTKADAHKAWAKLDEPTKAQCAEGLAMYVAWLGEEKQKRAETKAKHLETFISKRGWEPFIEARPAARTRQCWVTNDDPRWPVFVDRYRSEKGKPPPAIAGTQGNTGLGWFFPTEYLEPRAA